MGISSDAPCGCPVLISCQTWLDGTPTRGVATDSSFDYWIVKGTETACTAGEADGIANIINVNEVLPCGIKKTNVPEAFACEETGDGNIESLVGALVILPADRRAISL